MFENLLNNLKSPVSRVIKKSQTETNTNGIFKAILFSAILSLINILGIVALILSKYSKKIDLYSNLSYSDLWSKRFEILNNSNLISTFFKGWLAFALTIFIVSIMLFIIAKIIKAEINFSKTTSIVNNSIIPYMTFSILGIILGYIYSPIGLFVTFFATIFTLFTLLSSYRIILQLKNPDTLIKVSSIVVTLTMIAVMIIISILKDISLVNTSNLLEMLSLLRIS